MSDPNVAAALELDLPDVRARIVARLETARARERQSDKAYADWSLACDWYNTGRVAEAEWKRDVEECYALMHALEVFDEVAGTRRDARP